MFARNTTASGVAEVDADCLPTHPKAGLLITFDGPRHARYVAPLVAADGVRMLAMNFYLPSTPETEQPADLRGHLGVL